MVGCVTGFGALQFPLVGAGWGSKLCWGLRGSVLGVGGEYGVCQVPLLAGVRGLRGLRGARVALGAGLAWPW